MLFSTPFFLFFFLPVFFLLYWFLPWRRAVLLVGSMLFYGWSEPVFLLVVIFSGCLDWILGRRIHDLPTGDRRRKLLTGTGVALNLSLLVYAKYTMFAVGNFNALLAHLGLHGIHVSEIALPLGVSFIVFEKITYLVDLHRRVAKPAASLLDYLNYVFLFPKLLSGPIIKYHDISEQLVRPTHRYEDLREGTVRFMQGLAKKTLIADTLAPAVEAVFNLSAANLDSCTAWFGAACFTLQIYFDFSGYSDMAIGLGRILGFRILENFNQPYLATSFTDFWRRWHISLSSWIREYLYIPLGGNRVSAARSYVNLCICFLLSGLWHGAAWHFIVWGCMHGAMLVIDRAFWLRWQKNLPRLLNTALTLFLVMVAWVFFRCATFTQAVHFLGALFGAAGAGTNDIFLRSDIALVYAAAAAGTIIVFLPLVKLPRVEAWLVQNRVPAVACSLVFFFLCAGRMAVSAFHPFLYFRF